MASGPPVGASDKEKLEWYEREWRLLMGALESWAESGNTWPAHEFAAWLLRNRQEPERSIQ